MTTELNDSSLHQPASPGPYTTSADQHGPTAILQLQHGHFLITMSVTTTFPPSAVLPTVYALLPTSQLQCNHIDVQTDEKTHKMRVQIVGINPVNNPHAVTNLANRMKTLQPGASVTIHKDLSQLSVDSDSIAAISSLLMSSQSRALLDTHIQYYRLHSHPAFIPSLYIYISTSRVEHVLNVMRNFMADPVAGGAVRPLIPNGLEVKGEGLPSAPTTQPASTDNVSASTSATTTSTSTTTAANVTTPEKYRPIQSSSRSPHFKSISASNTGTSSPTNITLEPISSVPSDLLTNGVVSLSAIPSATSASSTSPPSATDHAAAAGHDDHDKAPTITAVEQTEPIRIDNKWWSTKRVELLTAVVQNSLSSDSLYVYNLDQIKKNVAQLKSIAAVNRVFYACKANHNVDILRTIYELGLGFECVSIQELQYIRTTFPDLPKDRLLFTPNFASKIEYAEAYGYTDFVNLDNIYPLEHWPEVFRHKPVMIRMDPGEGLGYCAKVQTGGAKSKFGVSIEQLTQHLPLIKELDLHVIGLHVHKGSGIHDGATWARTAQFLATFAEHFPELRILDLGGGLGVNYRDSDPVLDLTLFNRDLLTFRSSLPSEFNSRLELWLEPGRFIVANAGVLLSPVTQLKSKPGRNFIGLATGMNSLIRPALYESYHEIVNLSQLPSIATHTDEKKGGVWLNSLDPTTHTLVDVVGPICETGDVLGHARSLPRSTVEGDIILIDTAGAYGRCMSSEYNMRQPAKEVILQ